MRVSREIFRAVRWFLVGMLVVQLLIVPWRTPPGWRTQYAPIFARPPTASGGFGGSGPAATIDAGRLLVQLAVTGGLLLLWLRVAKPEE